MKLGKLRATSHNEFPNLTMVFISAYGRNRHMLTANELPNELLTSRDVGQVLCFCGAGISQAEAHLPNFAAHAGRAMSSLGSTLDSPVHCLFDASQYFEKRSGPTGS